MTRTLLIAAAALALAGCGTAKNQSYGSWLERVGQPQGQVLALTPEDRTALQKDADRLQAEAGDLRLKLAAEKDRVRRIDLLAELQVVGDRLRDVQTILREGGRRPLIVDRLPGAV